MSGHSSASSLRNKEPEVVGDPFLPRDVILLFLEKILPAFQSPKLHCPSPWFFRFSLIISKLNKHPIHFSLPNEPELFSAACVQRSLTDKEIILNMVKKYIPSTLGNLYINTRTVLIS